MHRKIVPGHPDPWIAPLSLQQCGDWELWGLRLLLLCHLNMELLCLSEHLGLLLAISGIYNSG